MKTATRLVLLMAALAGASQSWGADPFVLRARKVWEGLASGPMRTPYLVQIENNTDENASGVLRVSTEGDQVEVPLDLARRSRKEVPVYPLLDYGAIQFEFQSRAGGVRSRLSPNSEYASFRIGTIGDTSGLLSFLKIRRNNQGEVINDAQLSLGHCSPEWAPDRPVGYVSLDAVFLAEGSERLNPRQVAALKQYVLQGGRLMIPGGANVPLLATAEWQDVLPIFEAAPQNFPAGARISGPNGARYQLTDPTTATLGVPAPGASSALKIGARPLMVCRPIGLGFVVFMGANPFVEPLDSHPNRRQMVMDALRSARYGASSFRVHRAALASRYTPGNQTYYPTRPIVEEGAGEQGLEGIYPHKSGRLQSQSGSENPFNAKLIPSRTIGLVFGAFFFVVLPLNFLVLRLLKKLELAWVTTPIFSIAFAGILLTFAQGLYRAELSRSYNGFIVQDVDAKMASQWLRAEVFFPKGGTYNLSLPNSDQILSRAAFLDEYTYGYYDSATPNYRVVDRGEMDLPDVDVPNLAFREMIYHRSATEPLKISMRLTERGDRLTGQVRNDTDHHFYRVTVLHRGRYYSLPDLKPKATATIPDVTEAGDGTQIIASGRNSGQAVFFGLTDDFDPGGPGTLAKANNRVLVVSSQSVEVKP